MKIFLRIIGVIFLIPVLFVILYLSPLNRVYGTYSYKITVNIETPDGIKSGSAIRKIQDSEVKYDLVNWPGGGSAPNIEGEAVVIDLGDKGKLFGLIKGSSYRELFAATPHGTSGSATIEGIKYYNSLDVGDKYNLEMKYFWPEFVMFDDLSDPMSVKAVNKENISEQLGEGYSIQNIEIEITDKPIDWIMKEYLGQRHAVGPYQFVRK